MGGGGGGGKGTFPPPPRRLHTARSDSYLTVPRSRSYAIGLVRWALEVWDREQGCWVGRYGVVTHILVDGNDMLAVS